VTFFRQVASGNFDSPCHFLPPRTVVIRFLRGSSSKSGNPPVRDIRLCLLMVVDIILPSALPPPFTTQRLSPFDHSLCGRSPSPLTLFDPMPRWEAFIVPVSPGMFLLLSPLFSLSPLFAPESEKSRRHIRGVLSYATPKIWSWFSTNQLPPLVLFDSSFSPFAILSYIPTLRYLSWSYYPKTPESTLT